MIMQSRSPAKSRPLSALDTRQVSPHPQNEPANGNRRGIPARANTPSRLIAVLFARGRPPDGHGVGRGRDLLGLPTTQDYFERIRAHTGPALAP